MEYQEHHMPPIVFRLLATLALAGCSNDSSDLPGANCWEHVIRVNESASNLIVLCAAGSEVRTRMKFANPGSAPTTCTQSGLVVVSQDGVRHIALKTGSCANGRSMEARNMSCAPQSDGSLMCNAPDFPAPFKFSPASRVQ